MFQERTAARKILHLWMCCQLYPTRVISPFHPPLAFPSSLQHNSPRSPPSFFSPVPSPHSPPAQGCCSPILAHTQGNSEFPFPLLQFVTWVSSLPSFLALSQQGFHTFHLIYHHVPRGLLSSKLESDSACFTHLEPHPCSSLIPCVHLPPHKHKMLFSEHCWHSPNCWAHSEQGLEWLPTTEARQDEENKSRYLLKAKGIY